MNTLVAVVGPTAVGKSRVALELAERLGGEIVSADSRQVYRFMDIGTAKPTLQERARVPHHLIDVVDPDEPFTLACYRDLALAAIAGIHQRGKLPLLVGGSGLYVRAVTEGLTVPAVPPDLSLRLELEARAQSEGADALHRELAAVDPTSAQRIDPRNTRRVIRALEVWRRTGQPISRLQAAEPPSFRVLKLGLTAERGQLYNMIDQRVDRMMAAGFLEEVHDLVSKRYYWDLPSMSGLGYRQLGQCLRGEGDLEAAVRKIKYGTHRYARQQYAWFRLDEPAIRWFDVTEGYQSAVETLTHELRSQLESSS